LVSSSAGSELGVLLWLLSFSGLGLVISFYLHSFIFPSVLGWLAFGSFVAMLFLLTLNDFVFFAFYSHFMLYHVVSKKLYHLPHCC
jgi:hypothetical protein